MQSIRESAYRVIGTSVIAAGLNYAALSTIYTVDPVVAIRGEKTYSSISLEERAAAMGTGMLIGFSLVEAGRIALRRRRERRDRA